MAAASRWSGWWSVGVISLVVAPVCIAEPAAEVIEPTELTRQYRDLVVRRLLAAPAAPGKSGLARCFTYNDMAITLSPSVDEAQVRRLLERLGPVDASMVRLPGGGSGAYQLGNLWTFTATNPSVTRRNPFTLTYGYLAEGVVIENRIAGGTDPNAIRTAVGAQFTGGFPAFSALIDRTFARWGELTAIDYLFEPNDDGATFPTSGGVRGLRPDIRLAMIPLNEGGSVLAYNFFPNSGDMVLDSNDFSFWNLDLDDYRRLRNTVMHEHGHGLGFQHVDPVNETKLMESQVPINVDGPQQDDIRAAHFSYGDSFESNETFATASNLGPLPTPSAGVPVPVVVGPNVSIETQSVEDYYRFVAPGGVLLNVVLTPEGSTYSEGPENGTVAPINARAVQDLALSLFNPMGGQLAFLNGTGAGGEERLTAFQLNAGTGEYRVRVSSTGGADASQRYRLTVGYAPVVPTPSPSPSPSRTPSPTPSPSASPSPSVSPSPSPSATPGGGAGWLLLGDPETMYR